MYSSALVGLIIVLSCLQCCTSVNLKLIFNENVFKKQRNDCELNYKSSLTLYLITEWGIPYMKTNSYEGGTLSNDYLMSVSICNI